MEVAAKLRQYLSEKYNRLSLNPFLVRSDYFDCKIDEFWKFFLRKKFPKQGSKVLHIVRKLIILHKFLILSMQNNYSQEILTNLNLLKFLQISKKVRGGSLQKKLTNLKKKIRANGH